MTRNINIAILSVRLSVRCILVFYRHGLTYCHNFFTNHSSFTTIKHLREIPTDGVTHVGALNTRGI